MVVMLVGFGCPAASAMSYRPHSKPKVTCEEAIWIAGEFAKENRSDIADFYIDRVWWGTDPLTESDCWVVSWACSEKGWYFVVVYMDGTVRLPPKGEGGDETIRRIRPDYWK